MGPFGDDRSSFCLHTYTYKSSSSVSYRELTPLSKPLPIEPQNKRCRRAESNGEECQETISPSITQRLVHSRRKERESESSQASQNHNRSHCTRGKTRVRVDNIRLNTLEADNGPNCEDERPNIWHDPVDSGLHRPAIPE